MIDRPQSNPIKVALAPKPLGLWGTAMTVRRKALEVILAIATQEPIISSTSGLRWHMVIDPAALRHILKERGNVLFGLPLRQCTGMVSSILEMAGLDWPVPDFSTAQAADRRPLPFRYPAAARRDR